MNRWCVFCWMLFCVVLHSVAQDTIVMNPTGTIDWAECLGGPEGVVVDDGGVSGDYSPLCNSKVVIHSNVGTPIVLTGNIEVESYCDKLKIYDGDVVAGSLKATYSGTATINDTVRSGIATLVFTSDGSYEHSGFVIHFRRAVDSIPCGCVSHLRLVQRGMQSAVIAWDTMSWNTNAQLYIEVDTCASFLSPRRYLATTNPFIVTGLDMLSNYYVRLVIACDSDSYYPLSNGIQFSTTVSRCLLVADSTIVSSPLAQGTSMYVWGAHAFPYGMSEDIYRAEEFSTTGLLTAIWVQSSATFTGNADIYMGTTSSTGTTQWLVPNDLVLVYSGVITYLPGWNRIELDYPFYYDGTQNLLVLYDNNTGSFNAGGIYTHNNGSYSSVCYWGNSNEDPFDPPPTGLLVQNERCCLNFVFSECLQRDTCVVPQVVVLNNVVDSTEVCWGSDGELRQWHLSLHCLEDDSRIDLGTTTDTRYVLRNLAPRSRYEFFVVPDCAIDESSHGITFETPCRDFYTEGCFDFTDLDACYVECFYGSVYNPLANKGKIDDRHTVCSSPTEKDPHTSAMLSTVPSGHAASIRLGNSRTGAEAEAIRYRYKVDTTLNSLLILKYAAVLQDPGHSPAEQPRFTFQILDMNDEPINAACYSADFVASSDLGWNEDPSSLSLWKDWTTVGIDLSSLNGQIITIQLTTYDCTQSGHYGYAYFVLDCGDKVMNSTACGDNIENTFTAPDGFSYRWYREENPSDTLGTGRSLHVTTEGVYYCDLQYVSASSSYCGFTMMAVAGSRYPYSRPSYQIVGDNACLVTVKLFDNSIITRDAAHTQLTSSPCEDRVWIFDDGTTSTEKNPIHEFNAGRHRVKLVAMLSQGQCVDTAEMIVEIHSPCFDTIYADICEGSTYTIYDSAITVGGRYVFDTLLSCTTLFLTVYPNYRTPVMQVACDSFYWAPATWWYYTTTQDSTLMRTQHGCDSLLILQLTMHYANTGDTCAVECDSFTWYGEEYTATASPTHTLTNQYGCDSVLTLALTVHYSNACDTVAQVCDSMLWYGDCYRMSANPIHHLSNQYDCDSLVTLHLTVHYSQFPVVEPWGCDSLVWQGRFFDTSTSFLNHYTTIWGCDSIEEVHVHIYPSYYYEVYGVVEEGAYYEFDNVYYWDSTDVLLPYRTVEGCDSVVRLRLSFNSLCLGLLRFPNLVTPNGDGYNDMFIIDNLIEDQCYPVNDLSIYNRWGRLVYHVENISQISDFWNPATTNAPDGTYYFVFHGSGIRGQVERKGVIEVLR